MMPYLAEFITIATLHLLAVVSPGPDFAVVTRYGLHYGRRLGRWVSLGIGTGILLHVAYSLLGVAVLVHRYQWIYLTVLVIGGSYLGWLGWQAIRAQPRVAPALETTTAAVGATITPLRAFGIGFLTNGLNVKATLFFFMLFSSVIAPTTPLVVKTAYGLYLAAATAIWFVTLTYLLTWPPMYRRIWRYSHWVDRAMGALLLLLSGHIFWQFLHYF